ncbi:MAG: HAD-IIIA family hydrolase [Bacteroidota bacterium]|nr:HAD-IIIA family hydrolase [Bacteroidota bacterium]
MSNINDLNFKEQLKQIKAFVFDVDGVLSSSEIHILADGELARTTNVKDGFAIIRAIEEGYILGIISGGKSEAVAKRYRKLGIHSVTIGSTDKMKDFENFLNTYQLTASQVLYVGDDLPDIEVMKQCAIACCPADAVEDVKAIALYISGHEGGKACVRDVIAQVMKTQKTWYKQ